MGLVASHIVTPFARADDVMFNPLTIDGPLTQNETNGLSLLGTLDAPVLPEFLTNNPLPNGQPWGLMDTQTNYYNERPNNGVVRKYDFTISDAILAPDGYEVPVLLVNGQFPGPTIEANFGDTIQVTVRNNVSTIEEGTAIHWHGMLQKGSPWQDGVPAVTQCPIPTGQSFTYRFVAQPYGTSWYHSHYSGQYAGGIVGPLIIHGPHDYKYDVDVGPIMLTDWNHEDYYELVKITMSNVTDPRQPVRAANNLINGKNNFNCSSLPPDDHTPCVSNAGLSKFRFKKGKTHLLRLINAGSEGLQHFSIDEHTMTVVANDFVDVKPYDTNVVTLGIGQRADVLVKAKGTKSAYWMRSSVSQARACGLNDNPHALAVIYYDRASETTVPQSVAWPVTDSPGCENDPLEKTVPLLPMKLPKPDLTMNLDVTFGRNETNHPLWSFDGVPYRGNFNSPTLLLSIAGNTTFEEEWNVINFGNAKSVRVNVMNRTPAGHPMHLHGYNMYVLHEGAGEWDGTSIVRPNNPQRRDVFQVRPNGHLVMQFDAASNPGVWPFHCHIAWHVSGGFSVQFLAKPDGVKKLKVPGEVKETCRQWWDWTGSNIVPQIDSGI
jgi:FtsP/CotA-like multicopper oxidase with cupredoxin domain